MEAASCSDTSTRPAARVALSRNQCDQCGRRSHQGSHVIALLTAVNLITNGVLTLLRHPDVLERLRREPDLVVGVVEELLRYEPPIRIPGPRRSALADIDIAGTTIPKGAVIILVLAAGSRDFHRS